MTALRCANGCFSAALKPSSRHVEIAKFSTPTTAPSIASAISLSDPSLASRTGGGSPPATIEMSSSISLTLQRCNCHLVALMSLGPSYFGHLHALWPPQDL